MLRIREERKPKYKCGHDDEVIALDTTEVMDAYMNWCEIVGNGKDYSKCFLCWYKSRYKSRGEEDDDENA